MYFSNEGTSSSSLIDKSDNAMRIAVNSLDSILYSAQPNFIKMDIEGAEKEAILGAQKIIKDHSPVLAICLYHKSEDLWELPLLVNEINPNYDMSIRVHGHMGLSTVLYCIPRQKKSTKDYDNNGDDLIC